LQFDQNLKTSTVDVSFTAANTQVPINHGLGRVPTGYIQAKSNVAARVYDGGSANTDSVLYLKSDAIANVKVIVFWGDINGRYKDADNSNKNSCPDVHS